MCYVQNYFKQISLLTFVLVVQICSTTQTIKEETNLDIDQINSKINTETSTQLPEVSKETMDIITIIWYLSTFLALAAFFFLMACSDRRCGRNRQSHNNSNQSGDDQCPPTPSPSYSEFAPPSYESVVKDNCHIYVVPIDLKISENKISNNNTTISTDCKIHTINEVHKNNS